MAQDATDPTAYLGRRPWADQAAEQRRRGRRITELEGQLATALLGVKGQEALNGELLRVLARVARDVTATAETLRRAAERLDAVRSAAADRQVERR
jgi:uncharacterized coiled-coil protein SlyX